MNEWTEAKEGILYLEDGSVFRGKGFGWTGTAVGELVFNTSMTGYQQMLTDPSSKGQIITMTYPLVGNYGISSADNQSDQVQAFGVVLRDLCRIPSNAGCEKTLDQWLKEERTPGIYDVDTRKITRKLRMQGTMKCLISTDGISISRAREICDNGELRGDWMKTAGVRRKTILDPAKKTAEQGEEEIFNVAVLDFGAKATLLRSLTERNCRLTLYPYGTAAEEIMADDPDGIFLTNGPGDPAQAAEATEEVRRLIRDSELPMFGVSMGHQILSLALGGQTYRMKYGHRGSNHGVYDKNTKKSYVTAQSHGFGVQYESIILKGMEITHLNLNDGSVEGMEHRDLPIFSVQFQPEVSPGPGDNSYLFDRFIDNMKRSKADNTTKSMDGNMTKAKIDNKKKEKKEGGEGRA